MDFLRCFLSPELYIVAHVLLSHSQRRQFLIIEASTLQVKWTTITYEH